MHADIIAMTGNFAALSVVEWRRGYMRAAVKLLGAGVGLAMSAWGAVPPLDAGGPVAAVWKEQHIQFAYAGRTSHYSCDGMREKIRSLLLELGARRDLRITAVGCEPPSLSLQLVFSTPAMQRGEPMALDAYFESFTLTNDPFRNFGIADCELVQEFTRQVLPKFATRAVKQDISCVPYQASGSRYVVRGEILRIE
jgi:hypothetical protein